MFTAPDVPPIVSSKICDNLSKNPLGFENFNSPLETANSIA